MSKAEARDILMPDLAGAEEITVGAWSKKKGEHVAEGETLMEALTDKVNAEIPSTVSGTVEELLLAEGDHVKPGQPIARVTPE
jgi:2-oxoisovalerate dehydrogenase E2 component (dihydrolipoyl transacylase)